MAVSRFHIPGESTRRDYAVYVMVARHRESGRTLFYVGKTGDNREGCNPVISRAGNHFSFNKIHSQMRNYLPDSPNHYDFDYFYTTFGEYVCPSITRERIDVINEMERQLNLLAQQELGTIMNPYSGKYVRKSTRLAREALATPARLQQLRELVFEVRTFLNTVSDEMLQYPSDRQLRGVMSRLPSESHAVVTALVEFVKDDIVINGLGRVYGINELECAVTDCGVAVSKQEIAEAVRSGECVVRFRGGHGMNRVKLDEPNREACLYDIGDDCFSLDTEAAVQTGLALWFENAGYVARREVEDDPRVIDEIATTMSIGELPDSPTTRSTHCRDLMAHALGAGPSTFHIVEVKGRTAVESDFYDTFGQVFPINDATVTRGWTSNSIPKHGRCLQFAQRLVNEWSERNDEPLVTLVIVVPDFPPRVHSRSQFFTGESRFYSSQVEAYARFLQTGDIVGSGAFPRLLRHLRDTYGFLKMATADRGIAFRFWGYQGLDRVRDFANNTPAQLAIQCQQKRSADPAVAAEKKNMYNIPSKYRGTEVYQIVFDELLMAARYRGIVTYQEIAHLMGLPLRGSYMGKETGHLLGEISEDEVSQSRPMLSAVAVAKSGMPGKGYFGCAQKLGKFESESEDDERRFWEEERDAVYEVWKRSIDAAD